MKASDKDIFSSEEFRTLFGRLRYQPRISNVGRLQGKPASAEVCGDLPKVFNFQRKLNMDECIELLKLREAEVCTLIGDYAAPHDPFERKLQKMCLSEFVNKHVFGEEFDTCRPYAANFRVDDSVLTQMFDLPDFLTAEALHEGVCWLGGKGCTTPLHKDGSDNFAFHVFGEKRWVIFPVQDAPLLQLQKVIEGREYAVSKLDIRKDVLEIPSITCQIMEGECLYLPRGWSHYVETHKPSFMVNFWRSEGSNRPLRPDEIFN